MTLIIISSEFAGSQKAVIKQFDFKDLNVQGVAPRAGAWIETKK